MTLTDDQKAMLRLLAQREHGYEDIAALTGQSVDDVRAKVKEALAALDGSGSPADDQKAMLRLLAQREQGYGDIAALTGQSVDDVRSKVNVALSALEGRGGAAKPPPVAADPAPPPPPPAESRQEPQERQQATAARKPVAASLSRLKLPEDRGAVWGLGAGLAVVLVLVVLLATGALGGGGSSSGSSSSGSESTTTSGGATSGGPTQEASNTPKPTQAVLTAVGGGGASGRALFGKNKKQVILLVQAKGLEPSPQGKSYTVSLAKSSTEKLPLVATRVTRSGTISGSFQVAPQVLGLLASGFDTMEVSLVSNGELGTALKAARSAKKAPNYSGTAVLRGAVTGAIVEAGEQGTVKP